MKVIRERISKKNRERKPKFQQAKIITNTIKTSQKTVTDQTITKNIQKHQISIKPPTVSKASRFFQES